MRKLFLTLFGAVLSFATPVSAQTAQGAAMSTPKILIAYYSYSGNTAAVARAIQAQTGGDLYEIRSDHTYPDAYRPMTEQAKKEIASGFRPPMTGGAIDVAPYDVVFIGSPNWWGTVAPHIHSFLESVNLSGKRVIPFVTHGGGGVQNTTRDLTAACKRCVVEQSGWVGYGAGTAGLADWVAGLKL